MAAVAGRRAHAARPAAARLDRQLDEQRLTVVIGSNATTRVPQLVLRPSVVTSPALSGRVASDDDFSKSVTAADAAVALLPLVIDADKNGVHAFGDDYAPTRGDSTYAFAAVPSGTQRLAMELSLVTVGTAKFVDVEAATTPVHDLPVYAPGRQVKVIGRVTVSLRGPTTDAVPAASTVNSSDLYWRFADHAAGTYRLTYAPGSGYDAGQNRSGVLVTVAIGRVSTGTVFGLYKTPRTYTGQVFRDFGSRGVYDNADVPIPGVRVFVDAD